MKVGFIGAGNMGGAIIGGMASSGFCAEDILVYDKDTAKLKFLEDSKIAVASSAEDIVEQSDTVVLAVKPQMLLDLLTPLVPALCRRHPLVISIAAGKTLSWIENIIGNDVPLARVMPNIAAKVRQGMSAFCLNSASDKSHRKTVRMIFESVGKVVELKEELFSAFTAVAGSSPAFTLLYVDALANAGVRYGIPKDTALAVASQAVIGTTQLLQETGQHPRAISDAVCSPSGTTIEGVCALQKCGFENAVLEAVRASFEKDKKL